MSGPARVELHCHLDASVRVETIEELARGRGLRYEQPIAELATTAGDYGSLDALLSTLDVELDVLQRVADLQRAAFELVEAWRDDGVVHGEVRFAPQLHGRDGLSPNDALDAVSRGLALGRAATGISTAIILCVLRHQPPAIGVEIAELAANRRDLVAGLDLAGSEQGNPARHHRDAFAIARAAGIGITVHAGEADGPTSVWEALELGATRIGHGVRSVADPALVKELADTGVVLECAPACNVATGAVPSLAAHPINQLLHAGVAVTVNTDVRTPISTTLEHECGLVSDQFGWGADEHLTVQRNAARAAFVPPTRRDHLLAAIEAVNS